MTDSRAAAQALMKASLARGDAIGWFEPDSDVGHPVADKYASELRGTDAG